MLCLEYVKRIYTVFVLRDIAERMVAEQVALYVDKSTGDKPALVKRGLHIRPGGGHIFKPFKRMLQYPHIAV